MIRLRLHERLRDTRRLGAILYKMLVSLVITSVIAACSDPGAAAGPNRPYAPMQDNPYWRENQQRLNREKNSINLDTIPRGIFLRMESTGNTLIKFANSEHIFRYIIGSGTITRATAEEWEVADKEVDCRATYFVPLRSLEFKETEIEGTVSIAATRRPVPSHARFALDVYESADGARALILSADGPREPVRPTFAFGGSGGGTLGVRYAQIFDVDRQQYLADALALKSVAAEEPMFRFCWAPDQKIAVAYELQSLDVISYFEINFHIIETPR